VLKLSILDHLDDKDVIVKRYKVRRAGNRGATIEVTVPKAVVEREARRLGIDEGAVAEKLVAVWRYGSFLGLHLSFEVEEEKHDL